MYKCSAKTWLGPWQALLGEISLTLGGFVGRDEYSITPRE